MRWGTTARGLWNSAEPMPAPGRTQRADDAARAGALRGYDDERSRPAERRRPGTRRGELACVTQASQEDDAAPGPALAPAPGSSTSTPTRKDPNNRTHPTHHTPATRGTGFSQRTPGQLPPAKALRARLEIDGMGKECEHKKGAPLENLREPQERYTSAANPHRAIARTPRGPTTYRTVVRAPARSYLDCPLTYDCADSRTTGRGGLRYRFQDHLQRKDPLNYPARLRGHSNGHDPLSIDIINPFYHTIIPIVPIR